MTNEYYDAPTAKQPLEIIRSADWNANNNAVEAAFDLVPSVQDLQREQFGTDASTVATLYIVNVGTPPDAYYAGFSVTFEAQFASTGPASIQINTLPITGLKDSGGGDLVVGDIRQGQVVTVVYTSANEFRVQFAADAATAEAAAQAAAQSEQNAAQSEQTASTAANTATAAADRAEATLVWDIQAADFTAETGSAYLAVAATEDVDVTMPTLAVGNKFTFKNSAASNNLLRVLNPSYTIVGRKGSVAAGDDLTFEAGEVATVVARTVTILEVV